MPAILHPILICCRLLAHHMKYLLLGPYQSHGTMYELERSIFQTSSCHTCFPGARPACWLAGCKAITRLQQQKIAQRLRIQPSAKQPNRRGESGICVELPTAFLIRDYPPPCLGVPRRISPTPNTNPARRQQIRIGRMLSISTSSLAWT